MLSYKLTAKRFEITWTEGTMEIKWSFDSAATPEEVAVTLARFATFYSQRGASTSPAGGAPGPVAAAERPVPEALGAGPKLMPPPAIPPGADYELIPNPEQTWE